MTGITRRWLRGSMLLTAAMLVVFVGLFMYFSRQTYYSGVEQAIMSRFSAISGQLKITTASTVAETSQSRSLALRRMVEQFDAKDEFEFMLLDADGKVLSTSSGQTVSVEGGDYALALADGAGRGVDVYTSSASERVMAVTVLTPYAAEDVAALRLVTSLTLVDQVLRQRFVLSGAVAAVILMVALWSGLFFINSIVRPLGQVEQVATRIARGDLQTRLPDTPYNDEIGRLCATINQMADDLQKTEKMKNEFISSVSHELRTPLTSIKGWLETIAAIRDPEDENYRKGLSIIGTETDRLYNMVEELLDFSRLQNGIKLHCQKLDLVAELTDAALFMEARIHQEGLRLVYDEPEVMIPVLADPGRLRQVFINIMDNAIKYSSPGGAITLELLCDAQNAYVKIIDEGRGISPEDLENVKIKFFKGKNSVRGSGIGLAVVDEILTAMNGSVDITSALGKGTAVCIILPLADRESAPQAQQ